MNDYKQDMFRIAFIPWYDETTEKMLHKTQNGILTKMKMLDVSYRDKNLNMFIILQTSVDPVFMLLSTGCVLFVRLVNKKSMSANFRVVTETKKQSSNVNNFCKSPFLLFTIRVAHNCQSMV